MNRVFDSGAQKRKKKKDLETERKKLHKLDDFFKSHHQILDPQRATSVTSTSSTTTTLLDETIETQDSQEHKVLLNEVNDMTVTTVTVTNVQLHDASLLSEELEEDHDPKIIAGKSSSQQQSSETHENKERDVGTWTILTNDDVAYWIKKGPNSCRNNEGTFDKSVRAYKKQSRCCSAAFFKASKVNGEQYDIDWLVYSITTGKVYCFMCKLLATSTIPSSSCLGKEGFNDWKNARTQLRSHENSTDHKIALLAYLTRRHCLGLNSKLEEQCDTQRDYWRHVLQRVVAVIRTLSERGLAFRGSNERFGSSSNGNFLGLLELIAEFDPFLSAHIKQFGNCGTGTPSYLSKTICEEMIQLMANRVRRCIIDEIKLARYFSLSVDSTPDCSHVDQLTIIVRYVSPVDNKPVERFLTFLEIKNHTGAGLADVVIDYLTKVCDLDFSKCRGQSYDNAANMSGRYNGMQQKVRERNVYAEYIPCAGHSLNLVGRAAVDCCLEL